MKTTTTLDLAAAIESAVQERSLLSHPFYQKWSAGTLTRDDLMHYAKEYYWMAKHVPTVMEALEKNFPSDLDAQSRITFANNTAEEEQHRELWERFASSLGITEQELAVYEPTETVKEAVAAIVHQAEQGYEQGVAALYAFECDLPAISQSKIDGLIAFYGMSSDDAHAYFEEHLAEEKHLCFWRSLLHAFPAENVAPALHAARETVSAQNRILDGVMQRCGLEGDCGCV